MLLRVVSVFVCAAAMCMPRLARGEGQATTSALAVVLDYAAAHGCPGVEDFKAIVVGQLGYDAFREDAASHVLVRIEPLGHALEGRIEWRNAKGTWAGDRTFPSRSDDCRELERAMAFALALEIQLSAVDNAPPSSPPATPEEPDKTAEAAPTPPPPLVSPSPPGDQGNALNPAKPADSPKHGIRPTLAIGAGALVGFGLSSSAVPLARLFGNVAWTHVSLELAAEVGWPATTRRADGAGFSQQHLFLDVAGCGILRSWSACLVVKAGGIRVAGKDIDVPASSSGPVAETGIRLAFAQPLGRHVYVAAQAEALLNLTRWRVALDQIVVWTSPRFAATIGLDAGVRFP